MTDDQQIAAHGPAPDPNRLARAVVEADAVRVDLTPGRAAVAWVRSTTRISPLRRAVSSSSAVRSKQLSRSLATVIARQPARLVIAGDPAGAAS